MKNQLSERALHIVPILLVFYEISNYLANDAYLPAMPQIASQFQISHHWVQLTLTIFFLGNASFQLLLGPIADRYGRRTLLLGGGVVFIVTTLICSNSHHISTLLVARFFQGAAVTAFIVAGYATIHDLYDQMRAIKVLAWMNSITILAPAFGPLLGAFILFVGNWRFIFIILAIWGTCGWLLLYQWMPETCKTPVPIHPAQLFMQYARMICCFDFVFPSMVLSLFFAGMIAWIAAGPFLVMDVFHKSAVIFGLIQGFVFGSYMLAAYLVSRLIEKIAITCFIKISLLLAVLAGIFGFILNMVMKGDLFVTVFSMVLFSFSAGFGSPVLNRLVIEGAPQPMGMKVALFAFFMGLSGFLGSLVISSFYTGTALGFSFILLIFSIVLYPFYFFKWNATTSALQR